jgi:hypothetical protein
VEATCSCHQAHKLQGFTFQVQSADDVIIMVATLSPYYASRAGGKHGLSKRYKVK